MSGCNQRIALDSNALHFRECGRKIYAPDEGKCKLHCEESRLARQKKSDEKYYAREKERSRVASATFIRLATSEELKRLREKIDERLAEIG